MDPLQRARSLASTEDAITLYREWAEGYDKDVFDRMRVGGSRRIAELLAAHLPDRSTPILDLGCGTGAVGARLAELGFTDITGVDISPEMLAVAERKRVYRRLDVADLNTAPTTTDRFGASVSAGTFTHGHVGASAVPHLLALLAPGALLAWVVAPDYWAAFRDALDAGGVTVVSAELEPIRRDADDVANFILARTR